MVLFCTLYRNKMKKVATSRQRINDGISSNEAARGFLDEWQRCHGLEVGDGGGTRGLF